MTAELIANHTNSNSNNKSNSASNSIPKPEPEFIPFPGANVVSDNSNIDWEYIYENTAYPNGIDASPPVGFSTTPLDVLTTIVGDVPKIVIIPPQEKSPENSLMEKTQQNQVADAYQDIENDISKLEKEEIPSLRKKFESTGKVEDHDAMMKCEQDLIKLEYARETTAAAIMLFTMSYGYNPITYDKINTTAPYIYFDTIAFDDKFQDDVWEEGKQYNIIMETGEIITLECALDGSGNKGFGYAKV